MRTEKQKEYSRQYYINNKAKVQKNTSAYYFRMKALKPRKTCKVCLIPLPHHKECYCSTDCRIIGHRDASLQRKYGLNLETYNNLLQSQNNICAICSETCSSGMQLAVDHCHRTKKVRALLCRRCNQLLGQFDDNINLFKNTVKYLEAHHQDLHSG